MKRTLFKHKPHKYKEGKKNEHKFTMRERERELTYFIQCCPENRFQNNGLFITFLVIVWAPIFLPCFLRKACFENEALSFIPKTCLLNANFFPNHAILFLPNTNFGFYIFKKWFQNSATFFFSSSLRANWQNSFYFFSSSSSFSFVFLLCFFHPPWLPFAKDVSNS